MSAIFTISARLSPLGGKKTQQPVAQLASQNQPGLCIDPFPYGGKGMACMMAEIFVRWSCLSHGGLETQRSTVLVNIDLEYIRHMQFLNTNLYIVLLAFFNIY